MTRSTCPNDPDLPPAPAPMPPDALTAARRSKAAAELQAMHDRYDRIEAKLARLDTIEQLMHALICDMSAPDRVKDAIAHARHKLASDPDADRKSLIWMITHVTGLYPETIECLREVMLDDVDLPADGFMRSIRARLGVVYKVGVNAK